MKPAISTKQNKSFLGVVQNVTNFSETYHKKWPNEQDSEKQNRMAVDR